METNERLHVEMEDFRAFLSVLESDISNLLAKGDAYRWGTEEVEPDAAMAVEYFREAAEVGDWEAMELLADLLEEMERMDEAAEWRKRRAEVSADA